MIKLKSKSESKFKARLSLRLLSCLSSFFIASMVLMADIAPEYHKQYEEAKQKRLEGFYDLQFNTVSNLQFCVTNTGKIFYNEKLNQGTGIWPRGSTNYYIYGGGIWVGSRRRIPLLDSAGRQRDTTYEVSYVKWDRDNPITDADGKITGYNPITVKETKTVKMYDTASGKVMSLSYNTNSGRSVMVPGRVEDGDLAITLPMNRYRVFFSIDYNSATGEPYRTEDAPSWPIWDCSDDTNDVLKYDRYFGKYIHHEELRNTTTYPRGPAMISEEDIFCTYKDTDLSRYTDFGGAGFLRPKGYPQRIQYEQMIYSWGFGDYKDFIFIKYDQINMNEKDTLYDMWLAPLFDVDIADARNLRQGAQNDVTCFYGMEPENQKNDGGKIVPDPERAKHNMAYQYSLGNMGETGRGFGYCGFVFLESPAVIRGYMDTNKYLFEEDPNQAVLIIPSDSVNFIRKDKREIIVDSILGTKKIVSHYEVKDQLGLVTFRNWGIQEDKKVDVEMYNFIAGNRHDGPSAPADMRYMMATGPFHMRPHDTSRTVVGLVLAGTAKGGDADGTDADLAELVRKVMFAQTVYDNNFRAPMPPGRATITEWIPLNQGMIIKWDDVSENTVDLYEQGLDFMGYRIYRARRTNLDTFDVNNIAGSTYYSSGKGPFGWKELKSYSIPTPYLKSRKPGYGQRSVSNAPNPRSSIYMGIDSMMVLGPAYKKEKQVLPNGDTVEVNVLDINAILVFRIPRGVEMYSPETIYRSYYLSDEDGIAYQWKRLKDAGFYNESMYRNRVTAVIGNIEVTSATDYAGPWAEFLYKKCQEDGIDFLSTVKYYDPAARGSYLIDSAMLCTLHLNTATVKINPLFYEYKRIPVNPARLTIVRNSTNPNQLDTGDLLKNNGEVWITRSDTNIKETWYKEGDNYVMRIDTYYVEQKIIMDTLYQMGTAEITQNSNNPNSTITTIGAMILTDRNMEWKNTPWLRTLNHYNMVMDSIYSYVSKAWIRKYEAYDFSNAAIVRDEVIKPYMKEITNDHTFIDIGDDPEPGTLVFPPPLGVRSGNGRGDANILLSDNIGKTEQLFNNVEYFYKIVSFDEGDYALPTPIKQNDASEGLPNLAKTYPSAERAGGKVDFKVISQDTDKLGGLFDFKLFAINEERVSQLFAGDTIEVTFNPITVENWESLARRTTSQDTLKSKLNPIGFYLLGIEMKNLTKNQIMYGATTYLEPVLTQVSNTTAYVDYTGYRIIADTIFVEPVPPFNDTVDVGSPNSRYVYPVVNTAFNTGDFSIRNFAYTFGASQEMYGTLGLSFNAAIKQYGGMYRGDSVDMMNVSPDVVSTVVTKLPVRVNDFSNDMSWRDSDTANNYRPLRGMIVGLTPISTGFKDTLMVLDNEAGRFSTQSLTTVYTRFDNGPGEYIVEFTSGGTETLYLRRNENQAPIKTYRVPYLNIKVTDVYSYKRPALERRDVDSVEISSAAEIPFMKLPVQPYATQMVNEYPYYRLLTPSPINLPYETGRAESAESFKRKFNIYAQGYMNSRSVNVTTIRSRFAYDENLYNEYTADVQFVGTQGRYYLTTIADEGGDTVDFVHTINIAGAQFVLAYLMRGMRSDGTGNESATASFYYQYIYTGKRADGSLIPMRDNTDRASYKEDFKVGDKIKLITGGGVAGFPLEGAKVKFALSNPQSESMTDDRLDQIKIVPNPYVISHQSQTSPYDAKLYFTKLPEKCTIDIYSAAGDLVETIEHDESISSVTKGVAVWNLQTKNAQRVQSQTLLALIKTPDGSMTTKEFSIVVGGFRISE